MVLLWCIPFFTPPWAFICTCCHTSNLEKLLKSKQRLEDVPTDMLELLKNGTAHGEISLIMFIISISSWVYFSLRKRPQGNADYGSILMGW